MESTNSISKWIRKYAFQLLLGSRAQKKYNRKVNYLYEKNRKLRLKSPENLNLWERRYFSQNGEDGIIEEIFQRIGRKSDYYVEFGVGRGKECNTRYLREMKGWSGLLMDIGFEDPSINLRRENITKDNIEDILKKYEVPKEFDLLSIDIDGNDYYVWENITTFRPRVVIIEFNSKIGRTKSKVMPYDPNFDWSGTDYYGASLMALKSLGERKGYKLVSCDNVGVNAFFVRSDLVNFQLRSYEEIYRRPKYGWILKGGFKKDKREMQDI